MNASYSSSPTPTPTSTPSPTVAYLLPPCDLYITDALNNALKHVDRLGTTSIVGTGLLTPYGVTRAPNGDLYVADTGNNVVKLYRGGRSGTPVTVGSGFSGPSCVALANNNGDIYVTDTSHGALKLVQNGTGMTTTVATGLSSIFGVVVAPNGDVYYSQLNTGVVGRVLNGTTTAATFVSGLNGPAGMTWGPDGLLFVALYGAGSIITIAPNGTQKLVVGNLNNPTAVTVAPNGDLYISDWGSNAIRWVPAGSFTLKTLAGSGLNRPVTIAIDCPPMPSPTPSITPTPSVTPTPSRSVGASLSPTSTGTPTRTPTVTPSSTPSPTPSTTVSPSPSPSSAPIRSIIEVGGRATNNTRSGFVDPAGRAYAVTPAAVFRLTGERLQSSTSVYAAPNGRMIASAGMDARDNLFLLFSGQPDLYVVTGGGTGNLTLAAVPGVLVAPAELTVEPFSGDVFVTDPGNSTVCVLLGTAASFPDTIQVKSKIASPTAIVVTPSGALLVVDANTSSIFRVESGFAVPIGGVFSATPTSVTLNAAGDLFVVDGAMVLRVPGGQGSSNELVAAFFGGPGSGGALQAVAFDARGGTGRLFVFERARAWCVPRYNRTDGVGGASLAFQSALTKISFAPPGAPIGPALVVADVAVQAIRVIPGGATGTYSFAIPAPGTWNLLDVAMDRNGTLLAMDYKDGVYSLPANATATPESAFSVLRGSAIRIDRRDGTRIFFGSSENATVSLSPASSGPGSSVVVVVTNVSDPVGLAVDISGNIYVSDSTTHSVLRFGPAGGSGLSPAVVSYGTFVPGPWGIDVDDEENVLATDGTRLIVATRAGPRFVLGTFPNASCPAWEQGTHRICLAWASGISCFTPT